MGDYPVGQRALASILTPEAATALDLPGAMSAWRALVRRWSGRLDRDSLMRADVWYFLTLCGLFKTDRATMASGLESRVPMLGNPVLDLVLPQPASVRLAGGLKPVLRELARRHLPPAAWDRPKRGFTVPERDYLAHRWRGYCDYLVDRCADLAPWLDHREIERRWRGLVSGRKIDWPAYAVLVLLGWLETHPLEWS
jgi:asparagine synthase (glutamine-hydrolysing)